MQIGIVGLGKMGANMVKRLRRGGHAVVVHDRDAAVVKAAATEDGAEASDGLEDLCSRLQSPRVVWVMVPSGEPTAQTLEVLQNTLAAGDIVIDGGNSYYKDSQSRAARLAERGIHFLDAGTSGGVWGLEVGYCLMVGGPRAAFDHVAPLLRTLAPEDGFAYMGPAGAGHFVKMVHNGIEYAMMQAYAEGFELLQASPLKIDLPEVAELWRHGSVIRSWLLDLAASALKKNPQLDGLTAWVADSGEGRWTVQEAVDSAVAAPTIAMALFARFASRQENGFGLRMLAALRNEFGGHAVKRGDE